MGLWGQTTRLLGLVFFILGKFNIFLNQKRPFDHPGLFQTIKLGQNH
jgi:hypothetical protein